MWQGIKSRKHEIFKIYTCNTTADDLVLIGNVTWEFSDGQVVDGGFCARAVIEQGGGGVSSPSEEEEEGPRMKLYQGWTVRLSCLRRIPDVSFMIDDEMIVC